MFARHVIPLILLSLATTTCIRIGSNMGQLEQKKAKLVTIPPLTQLDNRRLNLITFGHRGLYDDLATIWALQFLVDTNLKTKSTAEEVFSTIHAIAKHHTKIEALYLLSCFVLANDFRRPDLCEPIFVLGIETFPQSWRIPMTQGVVSSFYLNDNSKAAIYYQIAASKQGSPPHMKALAQRLTDRQFINGQDLNESMDLLKNAPGGTRIIELIRDKFRHEEPPAAQEIQHVNP